MNYALPFLFLCAFSSGAIAQSTQQTPEGAQKFISLVSSNGSSSISIPLFEERLNVVETSRQKYVTECVRNGWTGARECERVTAGSIYSQKSLNPFPLVKSSAISICSTRFTFSPPSYVSESVTTIPRQIDINWDRVTKIEAVGAVVSIYGQRSNFIFSSSDLATRFAFAATFLRNHCDPTSSTGF